MTFRRTLQRAGMVLLASTLTTAAPAIGAAPAGASEEPVSCVEAAPQLIDDPSIHLSRLAIGRAWPLALGKGVTVAVVDSGVAANNAHLREAVVPGRSFVPGDADPTGRTDLGAHGTAVAGLIAARPVEGSAVYGVAPEATVLPVRVYVASQEPGGEVLPDHYLPDAGRMAEGIVWAARNGADVINVSMSSRENSHALRAAVKEAVRRDAVVVASGGNVLGEGDSAGPRYPAAYPGVIGVGATDDFDNVTESTVQGPHVDVVAPGQGALTAFPRGGDCRVGTDQPYSSYAAAYVSGLAALLRSRYPDESAEQIAYRIMASADRPRRDQRDDEAGWGIISPYEALTMTIDPGRTGPPVPGAKRTVAFTAAGELPLAQERPDPFAPLRERLLWWLLVGSGLVALALVVRPLAVAVVRRTRH